MRNFEDDPSLTDLISPEHLQRLNQTLSGLCSAPVVLSAERPEAEAVPVEFNLETIGWLSGGGSPREREAAVAMVGFLMLFIGKYRLAANLHHDATEAGYAELQRQNEALKASEARYKALSDQLQQKVDEQVSVIRQTQQELYESARLRSVGQLAAGVAHEINNPIGFIRSNLRVASDYVNELGALAPGTPDTRELVADFRALLDESLDGTRRISDIVKDLKTFSSIDQADYTRCRINDLLRSAVHLVQTEYQHGLDIVERLDELPEVSGHPSRLSQTFFNLLDNAAQALRDAEPYKGKGRILVRTQTRDAEVEIVIQDNGCGIADAHRSNVFDAFFTSRPVGSGTGLGLTVARDTVRAHQGTLELNSRESTGTRVRIRLPVNTPRPTKDS